MYTSDGSSGILLNVGGNITKFKEFDGQIRITPNYFFFALFVKLVHKKNICKARLITYFMGKSNFVCSFYQFNFKYIYFE